MAVMTIYHFPASRLWNTDETGILAVLTPPKIVARKGLKQVYQKVLHGRGVNTTMLAFISAGRTQIPPVFILPRTHFKQEMTRGKPNGCLGLAHPSGWINADTFLANLQHLVSCTGYSKESPHLLLLDKHSSHLYLKVIYFARVNGIVILTFPPHFPIGFSLLTSAFRTTQRSVANYS